MLRYRKLWMVVSAVIIVLVLVTSFLKPDLVTVVPNKDQLNDKKPDLRIQKNTKEQSKDTSRSENPTSSNTLDH